MISSARNKGLVELRIISDDDDDDDDDDGVGIVDELVI